MEYGNISIAPIPSRLPNQRLFNVYFFGNYFTTTVTSTPSVVREWIKATRHFNRLPGQNLVVGLGVQWNPDTKYSIPAGTLQLCIGRFCLVFQLEQADSVPEILRRFLTDVRNTFVGIRNYSDASKLRRSKHMLFLSSQPVDLRHYVAAMFDEEGLLQASTQTLVQRFFGYEGVIIDAQVSKSDWNAYWLTPEQILYASVDAYVAFQMGTMMQQQHHHHQFF